MTEIELQKTIENIEAYYSVEKTLTDEVNAMPYVKQIFCDALNQDPKIVALNIVLTPDNIFDYLDTGFGAVYNTIQSTLAYYNASFALKARNNYYLVAEGVYLDMQASNYGIVRKQNIKARCFVEIKIITGTTLPHVIYAGLTLQYNGTPAFVLKENVVFTSSEKTVAFFEAIDAGEDKNFIQGQDLVLDPRSEDLIDVQNSVIYNSFGAIDYEDDLTLRTRITLSFEKDGAGSLNGYKARIYEMFPFVVDAYIYDVVDDLHKGKVRIWIKLGAGEIGDVNFLDIVKQKIAPLSPATDNIIVKYANQYNVDFSVNNIIVYYSTMLTMDEKLAIVSRIKNLFASSPISGKIYKSQIIDVITHQFIDGVEYEIQKIKGVAIQNLGDIITPTTDPLTQDPSFAYPINLTVSNITFTANAI